MEEPRVLAIVPARAGSKGVPGKNLRPLAGNPLLAYATVAGVRCPAISRVIVSTDDEEIAAVGRHFGAEAPFLRPPELASDTSPDIDYILHALEWLERHDGWSPDLVVQLRPTTPLRDPTVLALAIAELAGNETATALRSAHALNESPHKMLQIVDNRFTGFFPNDPRTEYYNLPRQSFPTAYQPNGYVDIARSPLVRSTGQLYGPRIRPFVTEVCAEIDSADDFAFLEWQLGRREHPLVAMVEEVAAARF